MRPKSMVMRFKTQNSFVREFFAEFMGTLILIAIGDGSIASYVLKRGTADTFAICFCYGVGVLVGVSASINVSGAHLNPAVTLALVSLGKFPARKIPHYFLGQFLGGFFAAAIVYLTYFEAISAFGADAENASMTASIFATYPAQNGLSIWGALIDQIVGTAILLFCVMAVTDAKGINSPKHLIPMVLSLVVTAVCVAYGLNCGAILNPARDLSPRVFTRIAGWRPVFEPLDGHYWWVASIVGPFLGGIIGAWIYYLTIELHESDREDEDTSLPYREPNENKSLFDKDFKDDRTFPTIESTLNSNPTEIVEPKNRIKLSGISLE